MSVKSSSIIGGTGHNTRDKDDFYPTPPDCTHALLAYESQYIGSGPILEPCAGTGAISSILESKGHEVISWELINRGYGQTGIDYLKTVTEDFGDTVPTAIITNPPYKLAEAFIRHGIEGLGVPYTAMLLKSQFWHASSRGALWTDHQPARMYFMTWRPDFQGKGGPTMDFSWVIWDANHTGPTQYLPMNRPNPSYDPKPARKPKQGLT